MKEKRTYKIAGVILKIEAQEAFFQKELADFKIQEVDEQTPAITIKIEKKDPVLEEMKVLLSAETLWVKEAEKMYGIVYKHPTSVQCVTLQKETEEARIFLTPKAKEADTDLMYSVRDAFFFYLQRRGKVVVHSASFAYRGKAWLFSASSGVGKSTHVSLWKQCGYPIMDFNGDIAACYVDEEGQAVAASMPWCGTSGIYRNQVLPLGGVLFLKRGEINQVRQLEMFEGIIRMAARCVTPAWTSKQAEENISVAQRLAPQICMGELICTQETGAASAAKEFIDSCQGK